MINDIPQKLSQVGESLSARIQEPLKSAAAMRETIRQKVLEAAKSSQLDRFVDYISPPPQMLKSN
ncbi:MAG: hypothetical protein HN891_01460 [Planctomycetes bacterium]|jgi:hypothetical protein|nr:hypothetical protein [Planctomycetota bacterium]MBT6453252.1 hypothetical protein [Planctomycetota bacterium]MBT6540927.1 hypothetical protein [Planctomycetota bacterium]MBT6785664.1 hypothetical protein [Planctomycetota bacterium]MBT6968593.1 hypothetical protein [Planctomycetota bacterium]